MSSRNTEGAPTNYSQISFFEMNAIDKSGGPAKAIECITFNSGRISIDLVEYSSDKQLEIRIYEGKDYSYWLYLDSLSDYRAIVARLESGTELSEVAREFGLVSTKPEYTDQSEVADYGLTGGRFEEIL